MLPLIQIAAELLFACFSFSFFFFFILLLINSVVGAICNASRSVGECIGERGCTTNGQRQWGGHMHTSLLFFSTCIWNLYAAATGTNSILESMRGCRVNEWMQEEGKEERRDEERIMKRLRANAFFFFQWRKKEEWDGMKNLVRVDEEMWFYAIYLPK